MNKHKISFIIYILVVFSLVNSSCSDYAEELINGYYYLDKGYEFKSIYNHDPNKPKILGTVISYSYNEKFIIAAQAPSHKSIKNFLVGVYNNKLQYTSTKDSSENALRTSEVIADSIIKNDTLLKRTISKKINFWIIDVSLDKIYGPLSFEEYFVKRQELGIPDKLRLKFTI